jgi:hypothetical protein
MATAGNAVGVCDEILGLVSLARNLAASRAANSFRCEGNLPFTFRDSFLQNGGREVRIFNTKHAK